jgi:hypothetical protein
MAGQSICGRELRVEVEDDLDFLPLSRDSPSPVRLGRTRRSREGQGLIGDARDIA